MSVRKPIASVVALAAALVVAVAGTALFVTHGATAEAATTAGCGKAPTLTNGTRTIQSSGQNRSYILRIPDGYTSSRAYRLILGFHWLNGSAAAVSSAGYYGLQPLSNNSTIFVAPQGLNAGWANSNGQDLTLVDDILRQVQGDLCVDTTQVFALGWSYGGSMSFAVACARPTVFRAVAVLSGANLSGCNGGTQPVAYFGIHGTFDSVLNISNGRSLRDTFVRNNGCTAQNPPEPGRGSLTHVTTSYSGCRAGYPVQWAAFDGDHTPSPVDGSSSPNDSRTWTSGEIWRFFTQLTSPTSTPPTSNPPTSNPPTSNPPTSTPPTSPTSTTTSPSSPPAGACSAVYRSINTWPGGYQGEVTVTNTSGTTTNGWTVNLTLGSGQTITSLWNGTASATSGSITVQNAFYNGVLGANASTSFGFTANATSSTTVTITGCARS